MWQPEPGLGAGKQQGGTGGGYGADTCLPASDFMGTQAGAQSWSTQGLGHSGCTCSNGACNMNSLADNGVSEPAYALAPFPTIAPASCPIHGCWNATFLSEIVRRFPHTTV